MPEPLTPEQRAAHIVDNCADWSPDMMAKEIEKAIRAAVAEEREACLQIASYESDTASGRAIYRNIRDRGEAK